MLEATWSWIGAAVVVAVTHVALGPDHTLPFVALGRARGWSPARTLAITLACGLGHVGAALLLVALGLVVAQQSGLTAWLGSIDAWRGGLASWGLLAFGVAYALWGVRVALRSRVGWKTHRHGEHEHVHTRGHQPHEHASGIRVGTGVTFWTMFLVLAFGPCEPLAALLLPAVAMGELTVAALVALAFALSTLATMLLIVGLAISGVSRIGLGGLERWSHALAGGTIALSALAVQLFGW